MSKVGEITVGTHLSSTIKMTSFKRYNERLSERRQSKTGSVRPEIMWTSTRREPRAPSQCVQGKTSFTFVSVVGTTFRRRGVCGGRGNTDKGPRGRTKRQGLGPRNPIDTGLLFPTTEDLVREGGTKSVLSEPIKPET